MKALVKAKPEAGLSYEDVPIPAIGRSDVLIKVLRTGICGTDLHIYSWDPWAQANVPVPLTIGHEFVGQIVELGVDVEDLEVGDLVSGEGHLVCGRCRNCIAGRRVQCARTKGIGVNHPGAFAEYIALPAMNVWRHMAGIDLDVAASSTRSATPCTPRSASRFSARTSSSPERDRSGSWRRSSPVTPAPVT